MKIKAEPALCLAGIVFAALAICAFAVAPLREFLGGAFWAFGALAAAAAAVSAGGALAVFNVRHQLKQTSTKLSRYINLKRS